MELLIPWITEHLLSIALVLITLILGYHYLLEKETGAKLTKRYRNSIFEAQSKIFLNATQYLISGNRDLAIKEFLSAVDINKETIDTYFALGGLFRSNGEIEKSISIHRSLIARENITESHRLKALKELAIDFDKGGFVDKAIATYKDVLKINRDQQDVLQSLCRIYENIEDWEHAYNTRIMLSKVSNKNQAETISHIIVQKAKNQFNLGLFSKCEEELEEAFRFAPSVSAKLLRLKLYLLKKNIEEIKILFYEIIKEHPMYSSFIFVSLAEKLPEISADFKKSYEDKLKILIEYFLSLKESDVASTPSMILSKVRLLKEENKNNDAYEILKDWMIPHKNVGSDVIKIEYIKLLIELDKKEEAIQQTKIFLESINQTLTKHFCRQCGYNSDNIFWRCPQCHEWETIQFRFKV